MSWFKVDDKLHEHRKAHKAGKAAMGVWVLAGSWSSDNGEGGFVPHRVLGRWGTAKEARALVAAGLWIEHEKDGEKGWLFHQWDERNPDEASVRAIREAEREGATLGNHTRWHVRRGIVSDECEHCQAIGGESGGDRVPDRGGDSGANPPNPYPNPKGSVVTSPSQSSKQREGIGLTENDLLKVALATGGDIAHARRVERQILATASDVRAPLKYVLAAVKADIDRYRFKRGNPTKATCCRHHPGEWGDNCRICATEGATS